MPNWQKPTSADRAVGLWAAGLSCAMLMFLLSLASRATVTFADIWEKFPFLVLGACSIGAILIGYAAWAFWPIAQPNHGRPELP